MTGETAIDYSKLCEIDFEEKLYPLDHAIDNMLTRLEECETMIALVQQERCSAVGMTGSLTQSVDHRSELKELYKKIDAVEKLVEHANANLETLETKMDEAEKHFGIVDNTTKLKNFFAPIFKKSSDSPESSSSAVCRELFSTQDYFNITPDTKDDKEEK